MQPKVKAPATSGEWRIEEFTVEDDFATLLFNLKSRRPVLPGETYIRLLRSKIVVMSNTPAEIGDMNSLRYLTPKDLTGQNVLINGLGLGLALQIVLEKNPAKVIVVEKSEDVINMVAPYFTESNVEIVHDNCFTYIPPKRMRFAVVWHDIWDYICSDNLPEMYQLHRKYGRCSDWQGSWCREQCKIQRENYSGS